jgi:hypothetical protein
MEIYSNSLFLVVFFQTVWLETVENGVRVKNFTNVQRVLIIFNSLTRTVGFGLQGEVK